MLDVSQARLTDHAERRATQRSIPRRLQLLILEHADHRTFRPGGLKSALVTRQKLRRLAGKLPLRDLERIEGVAVLYDPASITVVTAFRPEGRLGQRYLRN
ncbi:MAG: hypothetical protein JNM47_13785 [Hyphomonadaceae bacterium]|nr:hypothetical protein [Hyphomonadaceae bacterium]